MPARRRPPVCTPQPCDTCPVSVRISAARIDLAGLDALEPSWEDWYRHHREVSEYPECWNDPEASWASRLDWYRRLLGRGAAYLTASDDDGTLVGYAVIAEDDTGADQAGLAEVVTLAVTADRRSAGVGHALLRAAEDLAHDHGFDTVKVTVVARNSRARDFYESCGYALGEHVLYRSLPTG